VSEREDERNRKMLREAIAPFTGEEIVAIGWFSREGTSEDSWKKGPRLLKRLFASGEHAADNLGNRNVLALTPSQVLVFAGSARPPLVRVKRQIAAWPLDRVHLESRTHTGHVLMNATANTYKTKVLRAVLTVAGEDRPLVMDFPTIPISREVIAAVKAATG